MVRLSPAGEISATTPASEAPAGSGADLHLLEGEDDLDARLDESPENGAAEGDPEAIAGEERP
jgi:hypothetical protein